ncbi:MAG: primosomal protein [Candidatus Actinomarinaceae bacterium]
MAEDMKLLTEWCPINTTKQAIKESREMNEGKIMLKGIIQRANTLNQNGRVYPSSILQREIMNYQKLIQENRAMGECDHPDTSVVELKNVSHIVRDAQMQGDDVYGVIEILDTPSGKIIQSLIESGITLGISSRGVGSTQRQGDTQVVQEDFQLICFDMVSEPSTPGAFMLREGKRVSRKDLTETFNKSDRVDRIFNEILSWE